MGPVDSIDRLYAGPLGDFIAARKELATRTKKEGDAAGATEIAKLAKPSGPAWAVNQIYWHARKDFDALLEGGEDVRDAMRDLLQGDGEAKKRLSQAESKQRARAQGLVDKAKDLLAEAELGATDATLDRVKTTLLSLATTGTWPGPAGRLARELEPPGMDALAAMLLADDGRPRKAKPAHAEAQKKSEPPTAPSAPAKQERGATVTELAAAREAKRKKELEAAVERARGKLARATEELEEKQAELAKKTAELEERTAESKAAEKEVARLEAELRSARVTAEDAERARARSEQTLESAKTKVDHATKAQAEHERALAEATRARSDG